MAYDQVLFAGIDNVDLVAAYGYPATAYVFQLQNGTVKAHLIFYAGANGGLFANAPNGSVLINTTGGGSHIEVKGSTGSWAVIA